MEDILLTSETSEWKSIFCSPAKPQGYTVEVNLTKSEELHDFFADYPFSPSRELVDIDAMSNERVDMFGKLRITTLPEVPKLLQTLHPKDGYVLHYHTLELYHELVMEKNSPQRNSSVPPKSLTATLCRPQHPLR